METSEFLVFVGTTAKSANLWYSSENNNTGGIYDSRELAIVSALMNTSIR